jgi:hypothetical protein
VVVENMLSDSEKDSGDADRDCGSGFAIACSVRSGFWSTTAAAVSVSTVMTVSTLDSVLIEVVEGLEVKLGFSSRICLKVAEEGGLKTVEFLLAAARKAM